MTRESQDSQQVETLHQLLNLLQQQTMNQRLKPITQPVTKSKVEDDDDHENNKKSLAIGAVVIFSFIYLSFQIII